MLKRCLLSLLVMLPLPLWASGFTFASIDGGRLSLDAYHGKPVLVVNTASRCGFTRQYAAMQKLYDTYAARGLVVLAVPSNDFRQELADAQAVREFCELTYGLTLPMTDITPVKGADAHPFYKWLKAETGFVPRWNFNKVLLGPDGSVLGTFASPVQPDSPKITRLFAPYLDQGVDLKD